jgi:photosystem II stability/assembly factor-like uncharacterized protein
MPSRALGLLSLCLLVPFLPASAATSSDPRLDSTLLGGLEARSIGPATMSGRVADVTGVASDPGTLYVGAASGGVWKSVNGGVTWSPIFDDQPVASIGAVSVFQPDPDIVWVGSGEANPRNSVSIGNGVYKSLDGGHTWQHLGLDETEHISAVVLHPTDPDTAWIAAMGKLWGENAERGVFKTTDGGKTWKKVLYVDERTGAADLILDPQNPNKLFAAMWDHRRWPWTFRSGGPGSGLYESLDGGDTWKRLTEDDGLPKGDLGRIGLAISRSDPSIVYALVEAEKSALLRSEDGGRTWKSVNEDPRTANRPFYYSEIHVDPQQPNRVYNLTSRLTVSDDGGKTFGPLRGAGAIHGDYHTMWIDPNDGRHIAVGEDGGVGISHDRGATWAFVANLPIGQFYHVRVDNDLPYHVYGGLQDNGSWRGPSSVWAEGGNIRNHDWVRIGGGDGFDAVPDPEDSMVGYSESQNGGLVHWNLHTGEETLIRPAELDPVDPTKRLRFNWNTGIAQDPFEPGTIYYGSQYVHKSTDRGKSWTVISPDLTTDKPEWQNVATTGGITLDVTGAENFTTILSIAPSALQRGVIWVGTDDGRIHVTRDGGKSWDSVEKNVKGVPADTWIPHILPSKFDAGSAFVVFDNHRRSDFAPYVYRTDDWGKTWQSLATRDLRGYALAIEQDPVDKNLLFVGTEFGLWFSTDAGKSWTKWKAGLPEAVSVMDLAIQPRENDLVIATHGRALYILDDIAALRGLTAASLREPIHLYPVTAGMLHYDGSGGGSGRGSGAGAFSGESRPSGALITYSLNMPNLPLQDEKLERARKEKERADARQAKAGPAETAPEKKPNALTKEDPTVKAPGSKPETALAGGATGAGSEGAGDDRRGGGDKEPKAEIKITDASGKVVRTMKGPARLGVNRVAWDLGRDAFREPPTDNRGFTRDRDESGPELPPGTYGVTVRYGGQEAKGTVQVVAAPYLRNTPADWQAHEATVVRLGQLQDAVIEAVDRIAATRKDVDVVLRKLEPSDKEKKEQEADPKAKDNGPHKDLQKAARDLQKKLTDLEKKLWVSPDVKGIIDDRTALNRVRDAEFGAFSTYEPPSANIRVYLDQAEAQVKSTLADVNKLFAEDVPAFRQKVKDAKIDLLADQEPITLP